MFMGQKIAEILFILFLHNITDNLGKRNRTRYVLKNIVVSDQYSVMADSQSPGVGINIGT